MQIEQLSANGPALAALLQECVLLRESFDGILIGTDDEFGLRENLMVNLVFWEIASSFSTIFWRSLPCLQLGHYWC